MLKNKYVIVSKSILALRPKKRKTKELISLHICTADLHFCSKSNHRFHSLSHDATFTMPRISKYVKIALHLQFIFNACAVIVVLL